MSLYACSAVRVSRRFLIPFILTLAALRPCTAAAAPQRSIAGIVVDQSGRALPRAAVRLFDPSDASMSQTAFTDESGQFVVEWVGAGACRVEVRLAGFAAAEAPCGSANSPMRLQLTVAPIRDAVVVTATRTEAPVSQVGASMTVFDEQEIERRQAPFVADLLRSVPGVMLVRYGAPGAIASLFVRGGESDYNKVLIDGIPVNEPGGAFYLNNLTTENAERIEVARGAYSSLFGSDAMASVIQLFTRRGDRGSRAPQAAVQLDGGTYGTVHASAAVNGDAGRFDYSLGAARLESDNRDPNSGVGNTSLSANVGLALDGNSTLRFIGRAEMEHAGTPGPTAFGRPDLDATFDRDDAVAGVTFDRQTTPALRQRVTYSVASSRQASTNLVMDPSYVATYQGRIGLFESMDFPGDSRTRLTRHHVSYQSDWRLASGGTHGDQLLTLLADWDGERATLEDRLALTAERRSRNNLGVAAQQQMLWRRVIVTVGARVEHNDSFGTALVPRGAIVYLLHDASGTSAETRLRASAGAGIKEPTMLESFSPSPFFRGNPDLDPERSRSVELGVEQRLAGGRLRMDLAWFDNRFEDIISLRTNPATFEGQYFNVGTTSARGMEVSGEAAPIDAVRVRGSYTFLDSEILESTVPDDPVFGTGAWAFRRPRHSGSAGATVVVGRVSLDLNGVFVGRFVDSDFGLFDPPLTENPGHSIWDGRVAVAVSRRITALLAADNIGNSEYSEPFGYRPLGRAARAGLRVTF